MRCFRCGSKLYDETDEILKLEYPLVCHHCDENMFLFEAEEEYPNEIRNWLENHSYYIH